MELCSGRVSTAAGLSSAAGTRPQRWRVTPAGVADFHRTGAFVWAKSWVAYSARFQDVRFPRAVGASLARGRVCRGPCAKGLWSGGWHNRLYTHLIQVALWDPVVLGAVGHVRELRVDPPSSCRLWQTSSSSLEATAARSWLIAAADKTNQALLALGGWDFPSTQR